MSDSSHDEKLRSDLESLRIQSHSRSGRKKGGSRTKWLLGAAAILVAGLFVWLLSGESPQVDVGYARVSSGQAATGAPLLSGSGYVISDSYISVGSRIPGRIEKYFVSEGQEVAEGERLVLLDDRDYRAALESAEASAAVARANLALAESELRRSESLRGEKIVSDQEFDVQKNKAQVSRATLAQLEAQLERAKINLEYTVLRAPSRGVVLAKLREVGEIAVPGGFDGSSDLIRLGDMSEIRAELDVNEADLNQIQLGAPARVVPDAYPDRAYEAVVDKIFPQVNRQKGTLRVEVKILEPDERLLADMSARITFLAPKADDGDDPVAIWIPNAAVRSENGESFVWAVEEGRARRIPVKVGERSQGQVRVVEGLRGGEAVVTSPEAVSEGQAVTIKQES